MLNSISFSLSLCEQIDREMELKKHRASSSWLHFVLVLLVLFIFFISSPVSASSYLSDSIFEDGISIGRNLLQAEKDCPVNFEFMNYTIITSQCKGPKYRPDVCCGALIQFACPYVDNVNDLSSKCASTMFSYINLYGRYPPGLFANECRGDKQGLPCPDSESYDTGASLTTQNPRSFLVLVMCLLVFFGLKEVGME